MKRRDFVSMLLGATTASILVPKRVFSLPTWHRPYTIIGEDFAENLYADGIALTCCPHPEQPFYALTNDGLIELNEASLETLAFDIHELTRDRGMLITIKPNRIFPWRSPWP